MDDKWIEAIFELEQDVRYIAILNDKNFLSKPRPNLKNNSASESDKYEELFVNPAILKLAHQRGELDCGGARFVLIRYGNFFQRIKKLPRGHLSICIDGAANALEVATRIESRL